jgi:hypothetical protein
MTNEIQSVGNSNTIPSKLFDAIAGQQQAKYYKDGLDYISNDINIIPRDEIGNIVLNEESQTNPELVISAVTEQISTKSVLRVLDTRFQYFKFPVQIAQGDTFNINTGFNIDIDTITTELKLPIQVDSANQPVDLIKINTSYNSDWFYGEEAAQLSAGFKQLPFVGNSQAVPNSYVLTKDIIDILIRKNQTLKFTIQTQYLTRDGNRTGVSLRLNRVNAKTFRAFEPVIIYSEANATGDPGASTNPNGFASTEYPVLFMEYFVDASDLADGDTYFLEAQGGNPAWILAANSYWLIEPNAIPSNPSLFGASLNNVNGNAGIYTLYTDTVLYNNAYQLIAKRNLGSNYELVLENGTTISNNDPIAIEDLSPFGFPGEYDGETRILAPGGIAQITYTWNENQNRWIQS